MDKPIELKYNEETNTYQAGYETTIIEYKDVDEHKLRETFKELSSQEEELLSNIAKQNFDLVEVQTDLNLYSAIQDRLNPEEQEEDNSQI